MLEVVAIALLLVSMDSARIVAVIFLFMVFSPLKFIFGFSLDNGAEMCYNVVVRASMSG